MGKTIINFITTRKHKPWVHKSEKIKIHSDILLLEEYLKTQKSVGFDTEFNSKRMFQTDVLLISLGNGEDQFVIDYGSKELRPHINRVLNDFKGVWIGHNIKSDRTVCYPKGIYLERVFDTMLAEQRLTMGMSDVSVSLEATYERRLKKFMPTDKEIRKRFIKMNENNIFEIDEILYSAGDVPELKTIASIQRQLLIELNQYAFLSEVECALVPIVNDMELEGFLLNEDIWKDGIEGKKIERFQFEQQCDESLKLAINKDKISIGTKHFRLGNRRKGTVINLGLFGDDMEVENKNLKHINYSSPLVKDIVKLVDGKTPTFKEKGKEAKPSLREAAINQYILENTESKLKPFLKTLIDYKECEKFISSYGLKFLKTTVKTKSGKIEKGYKNPVTGKVHTLYKQCFTETGRFSSGDAKAGLYNSQQIPSNPKILRTAFTLSKEEIADDWWITTCDLTGAEAVIMAALSNDLNLYDLAVIKDDIHSPIATKCWRAIYEYRMRMDRSPVIKDSLGKTHTLTKDFLINKDNNKQLRTDFKSYTFGCVYGMYKTKGAQTLNILPDEAQVAIDVIRNEFPSVFKMVEEAAKLALLDGYVIFNNVSNNRRYFTPVLSVIERNPDVPRAHRIDLMKNEIPFRDISDIEGAARNCRIQGTQADMLKTAMVRIDRFAKSKTIPYRPLLTVHDELVIKHKGKEFGSDITRIMVESANMYLAPYSSTIKMKADTHTLRHWIK